MQRSFLSRRIDLSLRIWAAIGAAGGAAIGSAASLYGEGVGFSTFLACVCAAGGTGLLVGVSAWLLSAHHKYCRSFRRVCWIIYGLAFITVSCLGFWDSGIWRLARDELGVGAAPVCIALFSAPLCLAVGAVWVTVLAVRDMRDSRQLEFPPDDN